MEKHMKKYMDEDMERDMEGMWLVSEIVDAKHYADGRWTVTSRLSNS